MDNMDRIPTNEELGRMRALGPRVRVMITSRHEIEGIPHLPLEVLEKEHVIKLFYDYYKWDKEREYKDVAWDIINSDYVRSHTLLVELVAKAANASFETLPEFRCKLDEKGFFKVTPRKFSTRRFDDNLTIEEAVMKLYNISILSPEQRRIMSLFSIFTPEKEIYGAVEDWADLDVNVVDELVRLGWLVRAESGFIIHQIVRDALAMQVGDSLKIEEYGELLARIIDTNEYMPRVLKYTKVRERLILADDVLRYLDRRTASISDFLECSEDDRALLEDTETLYNNIAIVFSGQSDYDKALEYLGKALTICESVFGTEHPKTATMYNNIAGVYSERNECEKALEYYGKALSIRERELGKEHPETATMYNNIADVYSEQNEYEKALEYLGKALTIYESVFGTEHPETATIYNNMALVFSDQGKYEKALEFHEKALTICERMLGLEHPKTATMYNNTALTYKAQGVDYEKALEYYGKAVKISKKVLGPEHPQTAKTYHNIACVFRAQGDYDKALEYYKKANSVFMRRLGEKHLYTQVTLQSVETMEKCIQLGVDEDQLLEAINNSHIKSEV